MKASSIINDLIEFQTANLSKTDLERYEFLGDSILSVFISMHLFQLSNEIPAGNLSQARAAIVNNKQLHQSTSDSKEIQHISEHYEFSLQNTFEAIVGYLYVHKSYIRATDFINKYLGDALNKIDPLYTSYKHPKNQLQEFIFAQNGNYRFINSETSIALYVNISGTAYKKTADYVVGEQKKQEIETELATSMLETLQKISAEYL